MTRKKIQGWLKDNPDLFAVEDLNLEGMQALRGRKVSDLAFAEFGGILEYVVLKRRVRVVKVD